MRKSALKTWTVLALIFFILATESGRVSAAEPRIRWSIKLPVRQPKWQHVSTMQRDTAYSPAAAGGLVFVGCEHNGALLALDAETGHERWRFYTNGALRTRPAVDSRYVLVGSDDGYVYCLTHRGELRWKAALGMGERFVIGHQRITSAWPVPTHPLLDSGRLYLVGGCWPADGVYVQAFDVESGKRLWKSPSMAMCPMMIPHWIRDGQVYVRTYSGTGGRAARFDINTGVASAWPKGTETPRPETVSFPGISDAGGICESEGLRFATGKDGTLYCAGPALPNQHAPVHHKAAFSTDDIKLDLARSILNASQQRQGYALIDGLSDGRLVASLLQASDLYVVAVEPDTKRVERIRRWLDQRGCFDDHRLSVLCLDLTTDVLPPYFANLVISESKDQPSQIALQSLRPYGGVGMHRDGQRWQAQERGPLVGAGSWDHEYANACMNNATQDQLVKAPLGVLWYGGPGSDRKYYLSGNRPSGALIANGRMFLQGKGVICAIDAFTGRLLWEQNIPTMHIYNGTHSGGGTLSRSRPWDDPAAAAKGIPPTQRCRATGLNWAVADDCLYVLAADQCLRFDPKTGQSLPPWTLPITTEQGLCWGCPRIYKDVLVATAFRPQDMKDAKIGSGGNGGDWTGDRMPMSHVFAVQRDTGKLLWSQVARHGFNNRAFVTANDRVFCTDLLQSDAVTAFLENGRKIPTATPSLRSFDVRSGTEAWSFPLQKLVKYLSFIESEDTLLVANRYGRVWTEKGWGWPGLTEQQTRSKSGRPNGLFRAIRGRTGERLWEISEQHYDGPFTVLGDKIMNRYGTAFDPKTGKLALRQSPLTGAEESFGFKKSGCAVLGACDSLVAWRTAYHDVSTATSVKLDGFEAGCTTSLLPACGMLNLPNFGMFHLRARAAALSMVHRPSAQPWSTYQLTNPKQEVRLQRLGYNFGAPGDRFADNTLWIHRHDKLRVQIEPREATQFIHGHVEDWITQSGIVGSTKLTLPTALGQKNKKATAQYNVSLYFLASERLPPNRMNIKLEGKTVLENLTLQQGATSRIVHEFNNITVTGPLDIELQATKGKTIICGVKLIQVPEP